MKKWLFSFGIFAAIVWASIAFAQSSNASSSAQNSGVANSQSNAGNGQAGGSNNGQTNGVTNGQGSSNKAGVKSEGQAILDRLTNHGKELDLNFTKSDSKGFFLSAPTGAPVVMYFWSGRDKESLAGLPQIRAAAAKYSSANFIGVNVDPTAGNNFAAPDGGVLPGTHTWEPRGLAGDVERRLGVGRVPMVYVFDVHGQLRSAGFPRELDVLLGYASK